MTSNGYALYQEIIGSQQAHSDDLPDYDELPGDVERVLLSSRFVVNALRNHPQWIGALANGLRKASAEPSNQQSFDYSFEQLDSIKSAEELGNQLIDFRVFHCVRIAWADIGGLMPFEQTLVQLSDLADYILKTALVWLERDLAKRFGIPVDKQGNYQPLAIIALGKLGAHALNFSSDVDLIFAFDEHGETKRTGDQVIRSISNEAFYVKLVQALAKLLTTKTQYGHIYRVDMRLRPFGNAGPLALSLSGFQDYYQSHGREWERLALIRARCVAGNPKTGEQFLQIIKPFVFRKFLDFGALESLRKMKQMIDSDVHKKQLNHDIKRGRGGIREIEFVIHAFQIVRGGRNRTLQSNSLEQVIAELEMQQLLPTFACKKLLSAYRLLRCVEHRLQQFDDQQTHTLPTQPQQQQKLAFACGYSNWNMLSNKIDRCRTDVRSQFEQILGTAEDNEQSSGRVDMVSSELSSENLHQELTQAGFNEVEEAVNLFNGFRQTKEFIVMDANARKRLRILLPDILRACALQKNSLTTLSRVLELLRVVLHRSTYLALLSERPLALSHLVNLFASSIWISQQVHRQPALLDDLLDTRLLYNPADKNGLLKDFELRLRHIEPQMDEQMAVLRQFKNSQVLRVAAADLTGRLPLMKVSDHLTWIAETVLQGAMDIARAGLHDRYGRLFRSEDLQHERDTSDSQDAEFAIVALGKLGGIELSYASDLDIIFIYEPAKAYTEGTKSVEAERFFTRLAQRLIHILSTATQDGMAYEIDTRLRPSGQQGVLVNSISALGDYLRTRAWTWEHQALVRARMITNAPYLRERFDKLRKEILQQQRDAEKLRQDILEMRTKLMRFHQDKKNPNAQNRFDIKHDSGGITDIEFLVQYITLRYAKMLGSSLQYCDNIRLLEGFSENGVLPCGNCQSLIDIYQQYRAKVHHLALQDRTTLVDEKLLAKQREEVTAIWHLVFTA